MELYVTRLYDEWISVNWKRNRLPRKLFSKLRAISKKTSIERE